MKETQAEKFKRWRNRIDVNKDHLKQCAKEWEESRDAYDGKILASTESDYEGGVNSVNLQYVDVRSTIPKLYSQNPYIYIDPETPESDLKAEVLERLINVVADKKWKLKKRMRAAIKAAKLDGRSYLKTSYKFDKDKIGRAFTGEQANDEICIDVVLRKHLIIPKDSSDSDEWPWVAHEIVAPIGKIREQFNLRDTDKPTVTEDQAVKDKPYTDDEKEDFKFGRFYEIEDREERTLSIIVDGVDRFVEPPYPFPYKYYSLYTKIEWNDIPGSSDTHCDLHFWKRQLKIIAEQETMKYNHSRKLNAKYVHTGPEPLTDEEKGMLSSYHDGVIIEQKPGHSITPLQHAPLGQEVYLYSQSTRQDAMIVSGMNEMKQGLPQTQKTARETVAIVAEAQDIIGDRAGLVEDAVADVIAKCIVLIQTYYNTTRVIRLTGMEQAEFLGFKDRIGPNSQGMQLLGDYKKPFLSFVGNKDLLGEMGVRIKVGSSRPVDENERRENFLLFLQAGQNPLIASNIDPKESLKEFAKILKIENKNIIIDPKSPAQENSLLKRDVPVMPMISENHDEHIAAHEMENNRTSAFINHIFSHKLLKSFVQGSVMQAPAPMQQGGELSADNISGLPRGSNVPPSAMPQPVGGAVPPAAPPPVNSGLPN